MKKVTNIRLEEKVLEYLTRRAKETYQSRSAYIMGLIREDMEKNNVK